MDDLHPIAEELARPDLAVASIQAPIQMQTGGPSYGWYRFLRSLDPEENSLLRSLDLLGETIDGIRARADIPPGPQVVAGFSQGGVMALATYLRDPGSWSGAIGMSTYLPELLTRGIRMTPGEVFMSHGTYDQMIPLQNGIRARDVLIGAGFTVEFREYPMEHQILPQTISDIRQWLSGVIPPA